MNLIGLDIGTTTLCGILYDLDKGETVKVLVKDNCFTDDGPEKTQNPDLIYEGIKEILDNLISSAPDGSISALSFSSQMHGILYVDKDGHSVSPLYTWQNLRGRNAKDGKSLEEWMTGTLGYAVYSGYGIVTHYSLTQENSIPQEAFRFCTIGDYIAMKLTDRIIPVTDKSMAASMGVMDVEKGGISENLEKLKIGNLDLIPEIVKTSQVLGQYGGIPVVQGLGDNQASFLGSVRDSDTSILVNYGTSGQISFSQKEYFKSPFFEIRPLGDEGFLYAGFSLSGGNSYRILSHFFEKCVSTFSDGRSGTAMKIMDEMDLDFSKTDMNCFPYFLGKRGDTRALASFGNISDQNFTPENMVKALVQGMTNELFRYYQELPDSIKLKKTQLVGAGNGIRRNKHLRCSLEHTYHLPLVLLVSSEESCLGAAINAGKGTGLFCNYAEGSGKLVKYITE